MTAKSPKRRSEPIAGEDAYASLLTDIVGEVHKADNDLVRSSNATLINLYWRIGKLIVERRAIEGYGANVVRRLSADLAVAVPGQRGFAPRSLQYMRAFAVAWPDFEKVRQLSHFLAWGHIQTLLNRLDEPAEREWYARRSIEDGWSRGVLIDRINAQLHLREGAAPSNFPSTITDVPTTDPALQALATDPYRLDFVTLGKGASERQFEQALVERITDFLQHLGRGFAYMGRQHRLTVGDSDFFLDLLFYNTHLHAYVVFELKVQPFAPEHVGKLNFYVTAIERELRRAGDQPTIGVLLVPAKDEIVVEYSLASVTKPMTVASYSYRELPEAIQRELPAAAEIASAVTRPGRKPSSR